MKISHFCLISLLLAGSACSTTKRSPLTYFSDIETIEEQIEIGDYQLKIEPTDELIITVTSDNPEATSQFNAPLTNPAVRSEVLAVTQPKQQTYLVDSQGDIYMPTLGRIHVEGMTVEQLRDYLTTRIKQYVADPIVYVDFVNYFIDVAGEVNRPGRYLSNSPRMSILDALSMAGDLTPYGERNNVLLIREENGKRTYHRLDLNSAETLTSPYFFLKQRDYVYVEPNNIRKDNTEYNQTNAFKLSVISTLVSGCSVVISLIIALTR